MKLQSWCNMIRISLSWYQIPEFPFRFMMSLIYGYVPFVVTKSRHFLFRDSSSNMTFHMIFNTTSTAGGTGSAYPSGAYMFTHLIHFLVIFSQLMSFWVMFLEFVWLFAPIRLINIVLTVPWFTVYFYHFVIFNFLYSTCHILKSKQLYFYIN